jgi:hypothetical protein
LLVAHSPKTQFFVPKKVLLQHSIHWISLEISQNTS